MNKNFTTAGTAFNIWVLTALIFSVVCYGLLSSHNNGFEFYIVVLAFVISLAGSSPAFISFLIMLPVMNAPAKTGWRTKICWLLILCFIITIPYGLVGAMLSLVPDTPWEGNFIAGALAMSLVLFTCSAGALIISLRRLYYYFNKTSDSHHSYREIFLRLFNYTSKNKHTMETQPDQQSTSQQPNKILVKGLITAGLILLMLIPTLFIKNLIKEREERQKEVVKEVSSKWATSQTLSGPFLVVPYTDTFVNSEGKAVANKTKLLLLANDLNVTGSITPEQRPRSIYKVLLYKTQVNMSGTFRMSWSADINPLNVDLANAKLCFALSDFKGIEEEIYVDLNGKKLLLTPGLPVEDLGKVGLSVPVSLTPETIAAGIAFNMQVKVKGSEQLHFIPLSAASKFHLRSTWADPSFDGDMLPSERNVSKNGFDAKWNFNQANLPFSTVMKENTLIGKTMAFGVSLVQPADQYDKTMRSVKYAILFIGLTFAFFFIIELLQKKPFHPVQYLLVGLALVIFYTLLLSISEYILFDHAYIIASLATILLISFYAQGHFHSWKTAGIFFVLLSCLYSFIFILIRLEDTALLVGSIGLFIVLALVMTVSRKINWYGSRD